VRDACLGWLPFGGLLARLGDPIVKRWMQRISPYAGEIDAIARTVNRPGIWLLHGAYLFGCTALADETETGPRLRRTLDWPFPGLGRLVVVVRSARWCLSVAGRAAVDLHDHRPLRHAGDRPGRDVRHHRGDGVQVPAVHHPAVLDALADRADSAGRLRLILRASLLAPQPHPMGVAQRAP
jgi:hypothetical protein